VVGSRFRSQLVKEKLTVICSLRRRGRHFLNQPIQPKSASLAEVSRSPSLDKSPKAFRGYRTRSVCSLSTLEPTDIHGEDVAWFCEAVEVHKGEGNEERRGPEDGETGVMMEG